MTRWPCSQFSSTGSVRPEVLHVGPFPEPHAGPGEVRVGVRAAGISPVDLALRDLHNGATLVIDGAAGGVGSVAVQLPGRDRALAAGPVACALHIAGTGSLPELIALTGSAASVVTIADFTGPRLGVRLSLGDVGGQPHGRHGRAAAAALATQRRFHIPVRQVYPLAQAAQAHASVARGPRHGRTVPTVSDGDAAPTTGSGQHRPGGVRISP